MDYVKDGTLTIQARTIKEVNSIDRVVVYADGLPHGTKKSDPTKDTALKLMDIQDRLKREVMDAELMKQNIADEIERISTPRFKELLYSRYILLLTWEDVTDRVSKSRKERYDSKHIRGYMHGEALREFERCRK